MGSLIKQLLIFLGVFIVSTLPYAIVILLLWNWFLVPLGVMKITFWHAVGIDCLAGVLAPPAYLPWPIPKGKELLEYYWQHLKSRFNILIFAAIIGWIASHFI